MEFHRRLQSVYGPLVCPWEEPGCCDGWWDTLSSMIDPPLQTYVTPSRAPPLQTYATPSRAPQYNRNTLGRKETPVCQRQRLVRVDNVITNRHCSGEFECARVLVTVINGPKSIVGRFYFIDTTFSSILNVPPASSRL